MADITSNLVARWTMDDTSGTTCVDSTGSYNGTYVNSPTLNVAGAFGSSKAVTFNGTTQNVNFANPAGLSFGTTDSFSVAFWLKTTASGKVVLAKTGGGDAKFYWYIHTDGKLYRWSGGPYSGVINDGTWRHFAYTFASGGTNTGTETLYVNGASVSTRTGAVPAPDATTDITLAYGAGHFLAATIDDARIYSRALSAADVAALYAYTGFLPFILDDCE